MILFLGIGQFLYDVATNQVEEESNVWIVRTIIFNHD
jgi:hypothetical protein